LVQLTFEVVTIITVVVIGVILALYLMILRKNGWLGGNSDVYRCPNQKCKGIFQKPIEIKDLSVTPARVYPACPECGVDLGSVLPSLVEKKPKVKAIPKPIKINFTNEKVEIKEVAKVKRAQHLEPELMKESTVHRSLKRTKRVEIKDGFRCEKYFGYIGQRSRQEDIPENCFGCPRITDCMLSNYNKLRALYDS
jgi:hypothetical protein